MVQSWHHHTDILYISTSFQPAQQHCPLWLHYSHQLRLLGSQRTHRTIPHWLLWSGREWLIRRPGSFPSGPLNCWVGVLIKNETNTCTLCSLWKDWEEGILPSQIATVGPPLNQFLPPAPVELRNVKTCRVNGIKRPGGDEKTRLKKGRALEDDTGKCAELKDFSSKQARRKHQFASR